MSVVLLDRNEYAWTKTDSFVIFLFQEVVSINVGKDDVVSGDIYRSRRNRPYSDKVGKELKCVDDLAAKGAFFRNCQEAMLEAKPGTQRACAEAIGYWISNPEAQELGNPWKSIRIIEQAIGYLGIALANAVNSINPGYVVADSRLFQSEKNRKQLLESAKQFWTQ